MIKYLKEENIDENLIKQLGAYRKENGLPDNARVIKPEYKYYCLLYTSDAADDCCRV